MTPSCTEPFNAAVKRKLLELLLPGAVDVSTAIIETALRSASRRDLEGIERGIDPALVGGWLSDRLGRIDLDANGVLDAGEWKVQLGTRRAENGALELIVLDAPFAGTPLPVGDGTIQIPDPQEPAVFTRIRP